MSMTTRRTQTRRQISLRMRHAHPHVSRYPGRDMDRAAWPCAMLRREDSGVVRSCEAGTVAAAVGAALAAQQWLVGMVGIGVALTVLTLWHRAHFGAGRPENRYN